MNNSVVDSILPRHRIICSCFLPFLTLIATNFFNALEQSSLLFFAIFTTGRLRIDLGQMFVLQNNICLS